MSNILLFGYGNPGRGDDAVGPALIAQIETLQLAHVICLNDMQLQVEHVTDLADCDMAIFVDADVSCAEPFVYEPLHAEQDKSYSTHAVSPASLLYCYQQVYKRPAPTCYLLRIRGYQFELGMELSAQAAANLNLAITHIRNILSGTHQATNISRTTAIASSLRGVEIATIE